MLKSSPHFARRRYSHIDALILPRQKVGCADGARRGTVHGIKSISQAQRLQVQQAGRRNDALHASALGMEAGGGVAGEAGPASMAQQC